MGSGQVDGDQTDEHALRAAVSCAGLAMPLLRYLVSCALACSRSHITTIDADFSALTMELTTTVAAQMDPISAATCAACYAALVPAPYRMLASHPVVWTLGATIYVSRLCLALLSPRPWWVSRHSPPSRLPARCPLTEPHAS